MLPSDPIEIRYCDHRRIALIDRELGGHRVGSGLPTHARPEITRSGEPLCDSIGTAAFTERTVSEL